MVKIKMDNDYDQEVFTFIQNLFINFTIRDAYYIFLNLSNVYVKIVQGQRHLMPKSINYVGAKIYHSW